MIIFKRDKKRIVLPRFINDFGEKATEEITINKIETENDSI